MQPLAKAIVTMHLLDLLGNLIIDSGWYKSYLCLLVASIEPQQNTSSTACKSKIAKFKNLKMTPSRGCPTTTLQRLSCWPAGPTTLRHGVALQCTLRLDAEKITKETPVTYRWWAQQQATAILRLPFAAQVLLLRLKM